MLWIIVFLVFLMCLFGMIKITNNNSNNAEQTESSENVNSDASEEGPMDEEELNYDLINDSVLNLLDKYPDFKKVLKAANMEIPLMNKFIPQGITLMEDDILITGYYANGKKSKCYVLNKDGEIINTVELDTNSHVGGIAYDDKNKLIWLPDNNGVLNAYNSEDFITKDKVKAMYKFDNVSDELVDFENKNKKLIAFLTIDEDYIYIGNFFKEKRSIVKKYKIIPNNNLISLEYINSFEVPAKTQSIAFFNKEEIKYIIFSNSYRRRSSSYIRVDAYREDLDVYDGSKIEIELPPMLEQVAVNGNNLYLLFESSASKYPNAIDKLDRICLLDLKKLIKDK